MDSYGLNGFLRKFFEKSCKKLLTDTGGKTVYYFQCSAQGSAVHFLSGGGRPGLPQIYLSSGSPQETALQIRR